MAHIDLNKSGKSLEPFQIIYRTKDQQYIQQLCIKFMAQWCHCHDQEENTNYHPLLRENWSGWSRVNKNHQKASLQWIRSCWKTAVSVHSHQHDWEVIVLERRPCSRRRTLKLDWSVLSITWTKKKTFWRKTLWSHETKTELCDHNEHQHYFCQDELSKIQSGLPEACWWLFKATNWGENVQGQLTKC